MLAPLQAVGLECEYDLEPNEYGSTWERPQEERSYKCGSCKHFTPLRLYTPKTAIGKCAFTPTYVKSKLEIGIASHYTCWLTPRYAGFVEQTQGNTWKSWHGIANRRVETDED